MNFFGFGFSKAEQPAAPAAPVQPTIENQEGAMRAPDGTEIKVTKGEPPATKSCTPSQALSWKGYELDPNLIPQQPERPLTMREKLAQGAASLAKKAAEVGGSIAGGATIVTASVTNSRLATSVSKTYKNWVDYYTIYEDPVKTLAENNAGNVINHLFCDLNKKDLLSCQRVNKEWNQFSFQPLAETIPVDRLRLEEIAVRFLDIDIPLKWRVTLLCTNALSKSAHVSSIVHMLHVSKNPHYTLFDKELNGIKVLEIFYEKYKNNPEVLAAIVNINSEQMLPRVPDSFFSDLKFLVPLLKNTENSKIIEKVAEMLHVVPKTCFNDIEFVLPFLKALTPKCLPIIESLMRNLTDLKYQPEFVKQFFETLGDLAPDLFDEYYEDRLADRDFMLMVIFSCNALAVLHVSTSLKLDHEFRMNFSDELHKLFMRSDYKQYHLLSPFRTIFDEMASLKTKKLIDETQEDAKKLKRSVAEAKKATEEVKKDIGKIENNLDEMNKRDYQLFKKIMEDGGEDTSSFTYEEYKKIFR